VSQDLIVEKASTNSLEIETLRPKSPVPKSQPSGQMSTLPAVTNRS
jgi:hypothetical protein